MSERDEFEAVFPMPPDTIRCGEGYAVTSYNAWQGMEFCAKWKGWKAARDTAKQAAVPVAWATVLPSGAIHAMRAKKADAERRTDAWNQDHPRPPLAVTKPLAFSTPQQAVPALTDEQIYVLAANAMGNPMLVKDLRGGFPIHTEPDDWLKFARAILAAAKEPR